MHIELEGGVWRIVEFQHVKPGKGGAFVRTKLKNLETGAVVDLANLGSYECAPLAGLHVLELEDPVDDPIHLDVRPVLELVGADHAD